MSISGHCDAIQICDTTQAHYHPHRQEAVIGMVNDIGHLVKLKRSRGWQQTRFNTHLCFRVPENPGLERLTKWRIPTSASRSGWKPLSETTNWVFLSSILTSLSGCVVLMVDEVAGDIFCRLGGGPETTSLGLELAILGLASSCLLEIHPVTKRRCSRQSKRKYSLFEWYKSDYLKNHSS